MMTYSFKASQALRWSVEAIIASTETPVFGLHTFWSQQDYELMSLQWGAYLKRLVKRLGIFGLRVFEFHEMGGLHVHTVQSGFIPYDDLEWAREDLIIGHVWQKKVWGGDLGGYLDKELTKQWQNGDAVKRRWARFGDFEGCKIKDIVGFGPESDCIREAFLMREKGEKTDKTMWIAQMMYLDWIKGGGDEHGDAYEKWCGPAAAGSTSPGSEAGILGVPF